MNTETEVKRPPYTTHTATANRGNRTTTTCNPCYLQYLSEPIPHIRTRQRQHRLPARHAPASQTHVAPAPTPAQATESHDAKAPGSSTSAYKTHIGL